MRIRLAAPVLILAEGLASGAPKMICFSAQPNAYLTDHAADIRKIYDGFFFAGGSWQDAAVRFTGENGARPEMAEWMAETRRNVAALRRAGVTENFLTVYYPSNPIYPTPETLLSKVFDRYMTQQFRALGRTARDLGFRGVCLDLEYAAERWELHHPQYRYDNYAAEDLEDAAFRQGYQAVGALLDEFPEAAVMTLPGALRHWAVAMYYQLGMIKQMADRNAPGGFHLGSEWTYYVRDPLTTMGVSHLEDAVVGLLTGSKTGAYWKRRCSVAPGIWPLHMSETDRTDVPVRPWTEEFQEISRQMKMARSAAKFYVWSYTGTPMYYLHTPELERKYKLPKQVFRRQDIDVRDWHRLLADKPVLQPGEPFYRQAEALRQYDQDRITAEEMCDSFGTPGRWWLLGLMGSLRKMPQFAGMRAPLGTIDTCTPHLGRDAAVRWIPMDSLNPAGSTNLRFFYGYRGTDHSGAHLVTYIHSPRSQKGLLQLGWDDGILVRLGDKVIFDALEYPGTGKGMIRQDSFVIEKQFPIELAEGRTRLSVSTMNDHGLWIFTIRFTDERGVPLEGLKFRLE